MPEDDTEFFMDDSITVAPAEDIPLDGKGVIEDFEKIQEATRPLRKKKAKSVKKVPAAELKKPEMKKAKAIKKIVKAEPKTEKQVPTKIEPIEPTAKIMPVDKSTQLPAQEPAFETDTSAFKLIGATVIGIAIILAIIFGVGYFGGSDKMVITDTTGKTIEITTLESYNYNGHTFGKRAEDNLWYTFVSAGDAEYFIRLHHGPKELEQIAVVGDVDQSFENTDAVYLTFDPNGNYLNYTTLATAEIGLNFVKAFDIGLIGACTTNSSEACATRPIITCENTGKPVILFKESSPAKVIMDKNCITIQGEGPELLKAAERLLYTLYGIML